MKNEWIDYDPSWLVELARDQRPELVTALKKCNQACIKSPFYIYFVSGDKPNEPGSDWQFEDNIILKAPIQGTLVLDLLKDGRVGGIEFLSQLLVGIRQ